MPRVTRLAIVALALLATGVQGQQAPAPDAPTIDALLTRFSDDADTFTQTDGAALYRATCQACHMEDGRGAIGAGAYPPLTGNPKMRSKHFVAGVILNGYHGMPGFGDKMSDAQVAEVTNHVRRQFANAYPDTITPDQVGALRPPDRTD
jgi:mono/diheme cytochrome c family protein